MLCSCCPPFSASLLTLIADCCFHCCTAVQEDNHSLDVAFLITRVLVFMCVNAHLRLLFEQRRLLSILVSAVLTHTTSPAALASTRPTSPASTPTMSPHRRAHSLLSAALQRQLVAELIKLICHLCMDDQGHSLQQAVSEDSFQESVEQCIPYLLVAYAVRVRR